jgi:hypothetical protein
MFQVLAGIAAVVGAAHLGGSCSRFTRTQALHAAHKLRVNWSNAKFSPADLQHGMNVEREHRNVTHCSPTLSAKIALAHLRERPDYYKRLARYVEGLGDWNLFGRYYTASQDIDEERSELRAAVSALTRLARKQERRAETEREPTRDEEIEEAESRRAYCFRIKQSAMAMHDSYKSVRAVTMDPSWGQTVREIESCSGAHRSDCDEDQMMLNAAKMRIDDAHGTIRIARKAYENHGCEAVAGPSSSVPTSLLGLKRSGRR